MSQTLSDRIRDYFKDLFKDAHTGVLLVYNSYEACKDFLQEERLAAYILLQYPAAGTDTKDYMSYVNVFETRFKTLHISEEVTHDVLDAALRHFKDPTRNPDIAPIIGEMRQYVKTSIEVANTLKSFTVAGPALWERLVMMNYTNKHLQSQHEELLSVVSSQTHSPPCSPTAAMKVLGLNAPAPLRLGPEETVRPALATLPLPGEGMPQALPLLGPVTVTMPLSLPLPGEGLPGDITSKDDVPESLKHKLRQTDLAKRSEWQTMLDRGDVTYTKLPERIILPNGDMVTLS